MTDVKRTDSTYWLNVRLQPLLKYNIKFYNLSNGKFKSKTTVKVICLYDVWVKSYTGSKLRYLFSLFNLRSRVYLELCFRMVGILVQPINILYETKRQVQAQDNGENHFTQWRIGKKIQKLKVGKYYVLKWSDVSMVFPLLSIVTSDRKRMNIALTLRLCNFSPRHRREKRFSQLSCAWTCLFVSY